MFYIVLLLKLKPSITKPFFQYTFFTHKGTVRPILDTTYQNYFFENRTTYLGG